MEPLTLSEVLSSLVLKSSSGSHGVREQKFLILSEVLINGYFGGEINGEICNGVGFRYNK